VHFTLRQTLLFTQLSAKFSPLFCQQSPPLNPIYGSHLNNHCMLTDPCHGAFLPAGPFTLKILVTGLSS